MGGWRQWEGVGMCRQPAIQPLALIFLHQAGLSEILTSFPFFFRDLISQDSGFNFLADGLFASQSLC